MVVKVGWLFLGGRVNSLKPSCKDLAERSKLTDKAEGDWAPKHTDRDRSTVDSNSGEVWGREKVRCPA